MIPSLQKVKELAEKWRTPVASSIPALEAVYRQCADELSALLPELEAALAKETEARSHVIAANDKCYAIEDAVKRAAKSMRLAANRAKVAGADEK